MDKKLVLFMDNLVVEDRLAVEDFVDKAVVKDDVDTSVVWDQVDRLSQVDKDWISAESMLGQDIGDSDKEAVIVEGQDKKAKG